MPEVRLIDGDAFEAYLVGILPSQTFSQYGKGVQDIIGHLLAYLRTEVPTIEAAPVRHGRWIEAEDDNGKDGIVCSECGHFVPFDYEYFDNPSHLKQDNKICNNCGAIMKNGGAENG